jgi:hypothetical protein
VGIEDAYDDHELCGDLHNRGSDGFAFIKKRREKIGGISDQK